MEKTTDQYFTYPPNMHELDLATLVSMYRSRGEPRTATPGSYFACALTKRLIKQGKWWFGLYYSQDAWDRLLTRESEGYPLTEVELNVLGLTYIQAGDSKPARSFVEQSCGISPKLCFLIVNDLQQFDFLKEDEESCLSITEKGEQALRGISRRIYDQDFDEQMLFVNRRKQQSRLNL